MLTKSYWPFAQLYTLFTASLAITIHFSGGSPSFLSISSMSNDWPSHISINAIQPRKLCIVGLAWFEKICIIWKTQSRIKRFCCKKRFHFGHLISRFKHIVGGESQSSFGVFQYCYVLQKVSDCEVIKKLPVFHYVLKRRRIFWNFSAILLSSTIDYFHLQCNALLCTCTCNSKVLQFYRYSMYSVHTAWWHNLSTFLSLFYWYI